MNDPEISEEKAWRIYCDEKTLDKCRKEEKFAYIVALAHANDALHTAYYLQSISRNEKRTPDSQRNMLNAMFLSCSFMYEALTLVRKMNKPFKDDAMFQAGLRLLLKDPAARRIERLHLGRARNHGIFHFDPQEFKVGINKFSVDPCIFVEGRNPGRYRYWYSDFLVGFMLLGVAPYTPEFQRVLESFSAGITKLFREFHEESQKLIEKYLNVWNFQMVSVPSQPTPSAPENQSQG